MRIHAKAQAIRAVLFDVAGVLTDGGIIYTDGGEEIKRFHVHDGQIIPHLRRLGFVVGAITGRDSRAVRRRMEELKLDCHYHGVRDKLAVYEAIKSTYDLPDKAIAYIGDDIIDLPILSRCGLRAAPADARHLVRDRVEFITPSRGGEGALRDLAELILDAQGLLEPILASYLAPMESDHDR